MKNSSKPQELSGLFKVLGDETRLRILLLLQTNELSVGELQQILTVSQSALSSHLALLRDSELVQTRKEGQKVFYLFVNKHPDSSAYQIVSAALDKARESNMSADDKQNLEYVLWQRAELSTSFFDKQGQGLIPPGQTAETLNHGFLQLSPAVDVVDMGCGSGAFTVNLAKNGKNVVGIDSSISQIKEAKQKATELETLKKQTTGPIGTLEFKLAQIEKSGLEDASFDLVIFSQSLHHVAKPADVLQESFRLTRPGGKILILDLLAHQQDWMREKFGDFWLGFSHQDIESWLITSGYSQVQITDNYDAAAPKGIKTLIATAFKHS